ncbi:MAG: DNA primase [Clostridia bacterium]|nr:DNA primase [Clostridia bacterium]
MDNIYEYIKDRITAREAAELYGYKVDRYGKMCCPFHQDRHPSAKADERFHCFVCNIDEDAIGFTSKLFDLSLHDAAKKLAADYGISLPEQRRQKPTEVKPPVLRLTREQLVNMYADSVYDVYCGYFRIVSKWLLDNWLTDDPYAREHFFDIMDIRDRLEDLLDGLLYGTTEEKELILIKTRGRVNDLERRIIDFEGRFMASILQ